MLDPTWRGHQRRIYQRATEIAALGVPNTDTFLDVVPGGGKSRCVAIMAEVLSKAGLIDSVIWVVPRLSLQRQAARDLAAGSRPGRPGNFSLRIGSSHKASITKCRNGFVTNFQALTTSPIEHLNLIRQMQGGGSKILLVADEVHYLSAEEQKDEQEEEEGPAIEYNKWGEVFGALRREVFKRGGHQLTMSGTHRRWDNKATPSVPYVLNEDLADGFLDKEITIGYDRFEALSEGAIVRVVPHWLHGKVQWQDEEGRLIPDRPIELSAVSKEDCSKAVAAFIDEKRLKVTHKRAIWDALTHEEGGWLSCLRIYANNKIIITTRYKSTAVKIVNWLNSDGFRGNLRHHAKENGFGFRDRFCAVLAVSGYEHCLESVRSFQEGKLSSPASRNSKLKLHDNTVVNIDSPGESGADVHCLVTVGVAHVGMDVPSATHLVHLGHYRSIPWLTQALARVWRSGRYDWPGGRELPVSERRAYLWAPADVKMKEAFEAIADYTYAKAPSPKFDWDKPFDPAEGSDGLRGDFSRKPELPSEPGKPRRKFETIEGQVERVETGRAV